MHCCSGLNVNRCRKVCIYTVEKSLCIHGYKSVITLTFLLFFLNSLNGTHSYVLVVHVRSSGETHLVKVGICWENRQHVEPSIQLYFLHTAKWLKLETGSLCRISFQVCVNTHNFKVFLGFNCIWLKNFLVNL